MSFQELIPMSTIPFDLDIDMLRCFVEVADTGSFTKAGQNIGLTQSGVSVKIRRLEDRLGVPVFNRSSKSLSLTLEGETLLDYAGRVLGVHDEAVIRLTSPAASGRLRVGMVDYFLPELLPNILGRFRKQYPTIRLEIHTDMGMNLIPMFERGELDLLVAGLDEYQGDARVLFREPLIWIMGQGMEITESDMINLALLPAPCSFRKLAIESLDVAGRRWDLSLTGTSIPGLQAAVQAGIGMSVLPRSALRKGLRRAPAHLEMPELPMFSLALITDEGRDDEARDVFIGYLEAELEDL
jgi:DNA-binding transcriptional LysR family regulator